MEPKFDAESTLIRGGRAAITMKDMVRFVATLENRPIRSLMSDLPQLAAVSESKFELATRVLRRRFREETPVNQLHLRSIAQEIARAASTPAVADQIRQTFAPDE